MVFACTDCSIQMSITKGTTYFVDMSASMLTLNIITDGLQDVSQGGALAFAPFAARPNPGVKGALGILCVDGYKFWEKSLAVV